MPINFQAIPAKQRYEQAQQLIRLKELAHNNRDFEAAGRFFALEIRCLRASRHRFMQSLDWLYDLVSDYGRSIGRPLVAWLATIVITALCLSLLVAQQASDSQLPIQLESAIVAALDNALLFIPKSGNDALALIDPKYQQSSAIVLLLRLHASLSFIFLF